MPMHLECLSHTPLHGYHDPAPEIVSLDPATIWDVLDDLLAVGKAVGLETEAEAAMVKLREGYWTAVDFVNPYVPGPEVLFLEWMKEEKNEVPTFRAWGRGI